MVGIMEVWKERMEIEHAAGSAMWDLLEGAASIRLATKKDGITVNGLE
jgi:hypothetical protein